MSARVRSAISVVGAIVASAALAATAVGLIDGVYSSTSGLGFVTTAGVVTVTAWPFSALLLFGAVGAWHGWQPAALVATLQEPDGSAPRLLAWIVVAAGSLVALVGISASSILTQKNLTAFKPTVVATVTPVVTLITGVLLLTISRPLARLLTPLFARIGQRLTPRVIAIGTMVVILSTTILLWKFVVSPNLALFDSYRPLMLLALCGFSAAGYWLVHRQSGRRKMTVMAAVLSTAIILSTTAIWTTQTKPNVVISVWSSDSLGGDLVDKFASLEQVRNKARMENTTPVARSGASHPNVVLITIDTVRADHTPIAGGTASMPALSSLAERGTTFLRSYSPGNVTRRSIPSLITGLSAPRVKGKVAGWALRIDPRHVLLAERFQAAGYATAGYMCCGSFWDPDHKLGLGRGLDELVIEYDGGKLSALAAEWIARHIASAPSQPYFLWLHFIEPHNWQKLDIGLTADEKRKLSKPERYDLALTLVDEFVGTITNAIDASNTLVAVTSDHGEGLGDHGVPFHSASLYNAQIHVPLVISGPGVKVHKVHETVSGTSLAATLLDLAGYVPPGMPQMDGQSLAELATGKRAEVADGGTAYAVMVKDRSVETPSRAVVLGRWKLIVTDGNRELYDMVTDPGELTNLAQSPGHAKQLTTMEKALAERQRVDEISAIEFRN